MDHLNENYELNNGYSIPSIGYGTWRTPQAVATDSVLCAIKEGYRHIDCAAVYKNEAEVGNGIVQSGVKREDLFITSKVWNTERGYEKTKAAFEKTLKDLQTDYLDLYLIHWPANSRQFVNWDEINLETWKAMTELYKERKIKAIGVSNFMPKHLSSLMKTEVKPMVNQIRFHPGMMQKEVVEYCRDHGIQVEAWSPLGQGEVLKDSVIVSLAEKYDKTAAQICLRWELQHGVLPLPKSVTPARIASNLQVFDFVLAEEDMLKIDAMDKGEYIDSDNVDF